MNIPDDFDPASILEFLPDFGEVVVETMEGIQNIPIEEFGYDTILSFVTGGYLGAAALVYLGIEEAYKEMSPH